MALKVKSKLEVLWQGFEKSGSIEAYLSYQQIKLSQAKKTVKAKVPAKTKR